MVLFEGLLGLGLLCLLVPVFAEYGKFRTRAEKAFNWIAVGGVSFILASAFAIEFWITYVADVAIYGAMLFQFIGWFFVLIGAILAIVTVVKK